MLSLNSKLFITTVTAQKSKSTIMISNPKGGGGDVPALLKTLFRDRPIDEAMKIVMEVHLHSARSDMSLALDPRFRPQLSVGARQTMYTLAGTHNRALPHRNCIMITF